MTFLHEVNRCPTCAAELDCSSPVGEPHPRPPRPGDLSMCAYCGEILVYDDHTRLRSAELNDLLKLPDDMRDTIYAAQELIHERRKQL